MFIWFQSPDTSPIFHRSSKITKSDPVISSARSCSSLEYNVPGKEAWSSMLTHSLFTSLSFSDLFYAPVCSTLSIHNVILLGRANEGQEFLNSFESISPRHLLLPFFFLFFFFYSSACSRQNFVSFATSWALSTSHSLSWAFTFLTSFAQIFIILYIHSLVSSHVLWRTELT